MNKAIQKVKETAKEIIKKRNDEIVRLKTELKKSSGERVVVLKMPEQKIAKEKKVVLAEIPITSKGIKRIADTAKQIINQKNQEILLLKTEIQKANGEKSIVFKMPSRIDVDNFPSIQRVKIENLPEPTKVVFPEIQKVLITNEQKETEPVKFPEIQKVEITNLPKEKEDKSAEWIPRVALTFFKGVSDLLTTLWAKGITVKLDAEERLKPLPVIIVDMLGRPVKQQSPPMMIPLGLGGGRSGVSGPSGTLGSGQQAVTTAGTRVRLSTATTISVTVKAKVGNAGSIYVGGSNVSSSTGFTLAAGDTVSFDISNLNLVYLDASSSGDGVSYIYI